MPHNRLEAVEKDLLKPKTEQLALCCAGGTQGQEPLRVVVPIGRGGREEYLQMEPFNKRGEKWPALGDLSPVGKHKAVALYDGRE